MPYALPVGQAEEALQPAQFYYCVRPFQQDHLTCWHGRGATAYVIKMHRDRFVRDIEQRV